MFLNAGKPAQTDLLLGGVFETIAHAMHGVQPLGITRIVADFGAQVLHMGVDGALVALEVVAQNLFNQFHARVHTTRVAAQRGEQLEFAGGKVNLFAAYEDPNSSTSR